MNIINKLNELNNKDLYSKEYSELTENDPELLNLENCETELSHFPILIDLNKYKNNKFILDFLDSAINENDIDSIRDVLNSTDDYKLIPGRLPYWLVHHGYFYEFNIFKEKFIKKLSFSSLIELYKVVIENERFELINDRVFECIKFEKWNSHTFGYIFFLPSAVRSKNLSMVKTIYKKFKNQDGSYCTVAINDSLDIAVRWNLYEVSKFLLEKGANPNLSYFTPLYNASCNNNLEIVKLLVEYGAKINHKQYEAFRVSAEKGYVEIVKYFLSLGVDTSRYNNYAIRHANKNGHNEIVKLIEEYNGK